MERILLDKVDYSKVVNLPEFEVLEPTFYAHVEYSAPFNIYYATITFENNTENSGAFPTLNNKKEALDKVIAFLKNERSEYDRGLYD